MLIVTWFSSSHPTCPSTFWAQIQNLVHVKRRTQSNPRVCSGTWQETLDHGINSSALSMKWRQDYMGDNLSEVTLHLFGFQLLNVAQGTWFRLGS